MRGKAVGTDYYKAVVRQNRIGNIKLFLIWNLIPLTALAGYAYVKQGEIFDGIYELLNKTQWTSLYQRAKARYENSQAPYETIKEVEDGVRKKKRNPKFDEWLKKKDEEIAAVEIELKRLEGKDDDDEED